MSLPETSTIDFIRDYLSKQKLDGMELQPGIVLIGEPGWNEKHKQWRCLANVDGMLCLVSLNITITGRVA